MLNKFQELDTRIAAAQDRADLLSLAELLESLTHDAHEAVKLGEYETALGLLETLPGVRSGISSALQTKIRGKRIAK